MNKNNSIAVKIAVAFLATAILICGAFGIGASTYSQHRWKWRNTSQKG